MALNIKIRKRKSKSPLGRKVLFTPKSKEAGLEIDSRRDEHRRTGVVRTAEAVGFGPLPV